MKRAIKRALLSLPFGNDIFRTFRYYRERESLGAFKDAETLFTHYFRANTWGEPESPSGPGSTLSYTENIRQEIPKLLAEHGVHRVLDAPCGDYNWFQRMTLDDVSYVGGDIVAPLIDQNNLRYANARTRFVHLDVRQDALPPADLWLCRDCLLHLSEQDIILTLDNFVRSGIRYLLTSTHPDCDLNTDIPTGSARLVNLQLPPYHLDEPLVAIEDWVEGFPRRQLALWERESVARGLERCKPWHTLVRSRLASA